MKQKARAFALLHHGDQRYGTHPYIHHLEAVAVLASPYGADAVVIAMLHDVIEDTCVTKADVEVEFGKCVADCVEILTDEEGVDRADRKTKTYKKMAGVSGELELALVVKVADRLANVRSCVADNNVRLLGVYRSEHEVFRRSVYRAGLCDLLWDELQYLVV